MIHLGFAYFRLRTLKKLKCFFMVLFVIKNTSADLQHPQSESLTNAYNRSGDTNSTSDDSHHHLGLGASGNFSVKIRDEDTEHQKLLKIMTTCAIRSRSYKSHRSLYERNLSNNKQNSTLHSSKYDPASIGRESIRLTKVEERLEMMSHRIDTGIKKLIQSSASTQILLDLSNKTTLQTDISNEVLAEVKNVRSELADVGQASTQAMNNVQKLVGMEETVNKMISMLEASSNKSLCSRKISRDRPRNCEEIQLIGHSSSGVYRIYPFDDNPLHNGKEVYCDLLSAGGGWAVIQRRKEPFLSYEDFERTWQEYRTGFGALTESHWIGLDIISELTRTGSNQLRIEMTDWQGEFRVAEYGYFRVANSRDLFRLFVTDYTGTAGDSLAFHNGMAFTTKDKDNDIHGGYNCAQKFRGAWWYAGCHQANLNGVHGTEVAHSYGVHWFTWHGHGYSLKRTEMKIRSRQFLPNL